MKKRGVKPSLDQIRAVSGFFEAELTAHQAPPKVIAQVNVAIDEIFSNIARYSGAISATVGCEVEAGRAVLCFTDNGGPYDPTRQADPDAALGAEEREIGGLGVFMVKKTMDRITYAYAGGMNVLTVEKSWRGDLQDTYATRSLEHGMDVKTLSALTGHVPSSASPEHLRTHHRRDAAEGGGDRAS